jgi:uncharacterized protein with ParB-like and HNH nuclease domain
MKASETKIEKFLASNETTFVIPVYQRNYDWANTQCKQLLNDITEVGKNDQMNAHFIGSIVYVHDDVYTASGITELTVIDGQQRLTTITLIYLALYRWAKKMGKMQLVEKIHKTYLINQFAPEAQKLKLKQTDHNRAAFEYILNENDTMPASASFGEYSRIIENFEYFQANINAENFEIVQKGLAKLIFIDIALDRQKDDPQRIFESLNSTGLKLEQGDLIRNYILMGLNAADQNKIYKNYWEIIEKYAKDETSNESKVSDFIRDYLTLENKNIPNKSKVYLEFKTKYPTSTFEALEYMLTDLKALAQHYNKLINPKNETDKDIRLQLKRIDKLEINVAYPFLMKVYDDYNTAIINKQTVLEVFDLVQSYCWRRFILGLPTNALNKIFMSLYDKVEYKDYLVSIQKVLLRLPGTSRFPRNKELIDALKIKDVYNIKSKNRMYLLERLENFENKEPVWIEGNTDITIEHIFPQNPDPKWKIELGADDYNYIKENYLNTIGNLTLSGYNGNLGNKSFLEKRNMPDLGYAASKLWLNKYLAPIEKWDKIAIENRFTAIAERVLKIWRMPDIDIDVQADSNEINIFDAEDPTFKKLEYAIFFDQKIVVKQVAQLYVEIFKILFELQPDTFFTTEIGLKIGLTKKDTGADSKRTPAKLTDTYFIESGYSNKDKFEKIKIALKVFEFQDELMIKYSE